MPGPPETWCASVRGQPSAGTLIYFPFRARGEPPHLVAAYMGLRLENASLPFSEYGWMKRTSPNGLCPWLVLPDGQQIAETYDICLHLAGLEAAAGRSLATTDDVQRRLFEVSNTPPLMHKPDNSNPENCAWLLNMFKWRDAAPKVAGYAARARPVLRDLEAQLTARFFGGDDAPGVGDLGLFATVDIIVTIAPTALDDLPKLREWYEATAALPGVSEYLAARPQVGARVAGNPGSLMYDGRDAPAAASCVSS